MVDADAYEDTVSRRLLRGAGVGVYGDDSIDNITRGTDRGRGTVAHNIVRYSPSHGLNANTQSSIEPPESPVKTVTTDSARGLTETQSSSDTDTDCSADSDCYDGDVCTIDSCNHTSGYCIRSRYIDCDTSPTVKQTLHSYKYIPIILLNTTTSQSQYVSNMLQNGTKMVENDPNTGSSVYMRASESDSSTTTGTMITLPPTHYFQYYGSLITGFAVNPNGVVSLAPVSVCTSTETSLLVCKYICIYMYIYCTVHVST